jgi:Na+/H+-dicarboxylate symporter
MKIWLKFLIGSCLGCILGFVLPFDNQKVMDALGWLNELAIRVGRYAVVPILFFSLTIAIYELRQDKQFWPLIFRSLLVLIGIAFFVIALGIFVTLLFPPVRIPRLIEEQVQEVNFRLSDAVLKIFPYNMLKPLAGEGVYLLPLYALAFFSGLGLSYDRNYAKPVITILDSLSRIFYYIASFFSEILGLVIIILAAFWAVRFHSALKAEVFRDFIVLISVLGLVLGFGILPLLLYLLRPKVNPWVVLYGSLGSAIGALFSGDINFSIPLVIMHTKENLGVRRRSNTVTVTLFTAFGRAGSAMVAAVAFIVIIRSYSKLGITLTDVIAIGFRAVIISFLLSRHPGDGAYIALAVLCMGYGQGLEAGYLILKPLAFYLIAIGTFLDVVIANFATFALARMSGFQEERSMRHFI